MSDFPTAEQEIVTTTPEPVTNELKEKGRILGEAFYKDPAYLSLLYPNKEETRQKTDPFLFPEEEELKEKKLSLKTATLVNLNIVQDNINLKGTYPPLKAVNLLVDLISRQLITYSPDQLNQLITNTDGVKAGLESIANPVIKQAMESVKSWPKKLSLSSNQNWAVYAN